MTMVALNPRAHDQSWFFGPILQLCSYSWTAAHNLYLHDWHSSMTKWSGPMGAPLGSQMLWRGAAGENFGHAQLVTGQINNGVPLLTQHSQPYVDKPLQEITIQPGEQCLAMVDPGYTWAPDLPVPS